MAAAGRVTGSQAAAAAAASPEALKAAGNALFVRHLVQRAVAKYSEAIAADPVNHVFYSNRAAAYLGYGTPEGAQKALADADRCIALNSAFVKGYLRRAAALRQLGRTEAVVAACSKGLAAAGLAPNATTMKLQAIKAAAATDGDKSAVAAELQALQARAAEAEAAEVARLAKEAEEERRRQQVRDQAAAAAQADAADADDDFAALMDEMGGEEEEDIEARVERARQQLEADKEAQLRRATERERDASEKAEAKEAASKANKARNAGKGESYEHLQLLRLSGPAAGAGADEDDAEDVLSDGERATEPRRCVVQFDLGNGGDQIARLTRDHFHWRNLNFFAALQLDGKASLADGAHRFRRLSALVHPDKNRGSKEAQTAFEEVKKAWEAMQDRAKRRLGRVLVAQAVEEAKREVKRLKKHGASADQLPDEAALAEQLATKQFAATNFRKRTFQELRAKDERLEHEVAAAERKAEAEEAKADKAWDAGFDRRTSGWEAFQGSAAKRRRGRTVRSERQKYGNKDLDAADPDAFRKKMR